MSNNFYEQTYKQHGKTVQALGWGSKESQELRFNALREIGILQEDSILDVGCGFADLYMYLGVSQIYYGVEENEEFANIARAAVGTNRVFSNLDECADLTFDWVVASGIFCFDSTDWTDYVETTLKKMFALCKRGVAINFLSGIADLPQKPEMRTALFDDLVKRAVLPLTHKFVIRHDYKPNDFTIYLYTTNA
jgi:hypothetical protein